MLMGIPKETLTGETRVAVTPETVKKLKAQGHTLRVQSGAGVAASVTDEAYVAAGAEITDAAGALGADMVLKVRAPSADERALMKPGAVLIGMLNPFDKDGLQAITDAPSGSDAAALHPAHRRALQRACAFIDAHLDQDLTLQTIAAAAGPCCGLARTVRRDPEGCDRQHGRQRGRTQPSGCQWGGSLCRHRRLLFAPRVSPAFRE